jgi:hypothetical protein
MARAVAEAGAAEEAAEGLTEHLVAPIDHGNATMPSRDAPMRRRRCREGDLRSMVQRKWRFHLGGCGRAEHYCI